MNLLKSIPLCEKCEICTNQKPLIQIRHELADIFWIGLSAVKTKNSSDGPLSGNTNSGSLIDSIENLAPTYSFYKTNLVKCLPLKNEKIRYPLKAEMRECFSHLEKEIFQYQPKLIFLLGKQVASFVLAQYGIQEFTLSKEYKCDILSTSNHYFIPVHHPSYILVYKRKQLADYIKGMTSIIKSINIREKRVA